MLFTDLGRIVSVDKKSLAGSTVTQEAVIAAGVRLKKRLRAKSMVSLEYIVEPSHGFIDTGTVLKRLRSIDAGTLSAEDEEAEEAVVVMDARSETMGDADESVLVDSDLIVVEVVEGDPPVAFIDDGSMKAVSSEEVTATETTFNDFDTLLDPMSPKLLASWVGRVR
jgi:hypothetical protein